MSEIITDFKSIGLEESMLENLDSLGYVKMTPIQEKGLPLILTDRDFIGQANTGSGKTAAFALGILSKLDMTSLMTQAVVVVPTRELAHQVSDEIRRLARFSSNVKVLTLSGGSQERHAIKSLKQGAHIVVGTPGRLTKLLEKKVLIISRVKVLVLDEADRLFEMGFIDEINDIAACTPVNRQTMLFSATFPNGIKELSMSIQDDPAQVTIDSQHEMNTTKQLFFEVEGDKNVALLQLLKVYQPESCLIFCNTKETCHKVSDFLSRKKMSSLELHSDLEQKDRTLTLIKFQNKSCRILVATDLASRGLDVKDVSAVINYDLIRKAELYVHRIGRTGRAGQEGLALSLYLPKEKQMLESISEYLRVECQRMPLDQLEEGESPDLTSKMGTIYISGGKKDGLRPGDILGALTKDAGLDGASVGKINILDVNSYVAIAHDKIKDAVSKLSAGKIKRKRFKVGKA